MAINKAAFLQQAFLKMLHLLKLAFSRTFYDLLDGFGHDALHHFPKYTLLFYKNIKNLQKVLDI